jgi:hypothetical protein
VNREQDPLLLGLLHLLAQERIERCSTHHRRVENLPGEDVDRRAQHRDLAVLRDVLDPRLPPAFERQ